MSKSQIDRADWSSRSESLLVAARADHDATAGDRTRVAAALARRLAGGVAATLTVDGRAQAVAQKQASAITLASLAKLTVGVSLVVASTLAIMRTADESPAPPRALPLAPSQPTQEPAAGPAAQPRAIESAPSVAPTSIEGPRSARDIVAAADTRLETNAETNADRKQRPPVRPPRARVSSAKRSASGSDAATRERATTLAAAGLTAAEGATSGEGAPNPSESESKVSTLAASSRPESAALSQPASAEQPVRPTVQAKAEPTRNDESLDARAELALVERIHATMRASKPSAALALCVEHERRWPHGTFAQERDAVRAIASCDTKSTQANARARAFLAKYPSAPLAPRVATACAATLSALHIEE